MNILNKIVFSNNIYLYLLLFLFLPIVLFYNSKIFTNKTYNNYFLSKTSTCCIRGLCIIVIIFHHVSQEMKFPHLLQPITTLGYPAVSIFLFLSGYGLTISFLNKRNYLENFFSKRLNKVYLPFVFINFLFIIILRFVFNNKFSLKDTFEYSLGINLLDSTSWFVITIMLLYVSFYLSFKLFKKNTALIILIIYSCAYFIFCHKINLGSYWFNTSFCFPIGVYTALSHNKFIDFIKRNYKKLLNINLICFCIPFLIAQHSNLSTQFIFESISSIFFIFLSLTFFLKVKLFSKLLYLCGSISYELYIIHMKLLLIYFKLVHIRASYTIYIYLCLLIIISLILNKFSNLMQINSTAVQKYGKSSKKSA